MGHHGREFGTFKYRTSEALEARVQEFYDYCEVNDKPLTVTRLAAFLGLSRATVWHYSNNPLFADILAHAKVMIEADMEERLQAGKGSAAGVIFSMKNNFGWKDQTEVNQTIGGELGVRTVVINGIAATNPRNISATVRALPVQGALRRERGGEELGDS
jgi:hypothetical protein